jgi:hypothetical protein
VKRMAGQLVRLLFHEVSAYEGRRGT